MAHTPHLDLAKEVEDAKGEVVVGGIYYHWRDPNQHYRVTAVAIDEASEELVVVYELLVEPKPVTWVRRLRGRNGWLTPVAPSGIEIPRFQLVIS